MDQRPITRPTRIAFWAAVAVTAFYCAFVLPFHFPLSEPVYSAAYTVGANNRVAAIAIAIIGVIVIIACRWFTIDSRKSDSLAYSATEQLSRKYLWWAVAAMVICTTILGSLVVRQGAYYSDEGYFITQLRSGLVFHRVLYSEFEFPYGPAFYSWPALFVRALAPFGISLPAAYMASVVVMGALGVCLLFYIVQSLPLRRDLKAVAFILVTFCAFDTALGLNYAVLRAVLPFAVVVLLAKQKSLWRAMTVACLGEILQFAVSPELGIAFGGAAIGYGLYRAFATGWRWLTVAVATALGGGIFVALVSHNYFLILREMAKGGYNIILEPLPFVLVLLVAVAMLAPLAVARSLWHRTSAEGHEQGLLVALYVATLGMLPGALSRCDPLHAFFDGVGAYLLSFVAIGRTTPKWQRVWIVVVALTFAATQFQEVHAFRTEILSALRQSPPDKYDDPSIVPAISQTVGAAKVAMPWSTSLHMADALTKTGQYQPGYFCSHFGAFDMDSELRRVADMRSAKFVLVPIGQDLVYEDEIDNHGIKRWVRFGFKYSARRPPFYEGAHMVQELTANWKQVGTFGMYILYRKVR